MRTSLQHPKHWLRLTLAAGAFSAFALAANAQNFGPDLFNEQFDDTQDSDGDAFNLRAWGSLNSGTGNPAAPSLEISYNGSDTGFLRSEIGLFESVGNRVHQVQLRIREPGGPLSGRFFGLTGQSSGTLAQTSLDTGGTGSFNSDTQTLITADSGIVNLIPDLVGRIDGSGDSVLYDNVRVARETAAPVISSNDAGTLTVGQSATFSLFNSGGTDGNGNNVFFDPDMLVASSGATISSSSWINDTEFQVTLTPNSQSFSLDVENPYGALNDSTAFSAVPEPSAFALAFGLAGLAAALLRRRKS